MARLTCFFCDAVLPDRRLYCDRLCEPVTSLALGINWVYLMAERGEVDAAGQRRLLADALGMAT